MKQVIFSFLTITIFAAVLVVGCKKDEVVQPASVEVANLVEPDATELSQPSDGEGVTERSACTTVTDACGLGNYTNCVKYARCKQPALPFGLFTYQDKLNIINIQTAAAGRVAIINTGNNVGHVAYVQSVSGTSITIRETNWCSTTKVSTRTGTKAALNIVGYFKP